MAQGAYGDQIEALVEVEGRPRLPIARGTDFAAALQARGHWGSQEGKDQFKSDRHQQQRNPTMTLRFSSVHPAVLGALALVSLLAPAVEAGEAKATATEGNVRIVLVGDSTVTDAGGWGAAFAKLLAPQVQCSNMARSGRSSKSYLNEGHWRKALEQKPDYILIQFGHNDMPGKGPERETDPDTTYQQYLARYIDEARAAGARPILVTSMTRRLFSQQGKIQSNLVPYALAAKKVAQEKKVPLVDLHARSIELLDKMGPREAAALNPATKDPRKPDLTHLSAKGSEVMARLVADELRKVEPQLAKYLK